jgi:hypothetical protein
MVFRRSALIFPLALAALSGCVAPATVSPVRDYRLVDEWDSRRPLDVAVLAPTGDAPRGAMEAVREAARLFLLDRRYAPVREKEIDRDPGLFRPGGPNAVLEIRILKWNESRMLADGSVLVDAEVRLYGVGSLDILYMATLHNESVRSRKTPIDSEGFGSTREEAARELAESLLARLPMKADG